MWSPQFVIWLVPFAVLTRPRLWPYLWWQLSEIIYYLAIWSHLVYYIARDGYQITGYPGIKRRLVILYPGHQIGWCCWCCWCLPPTW